MIDLKDIQIYIERAKIVAPAVDFNAIKICICKGQLTIGGRNCWGVYNKGKRIIITNKVGKKQGFAVFLHELGHHLTWLQLGSEVYSTCSEYELEIFADMYGLEMSLELNFEYEKWLGRKLGKIPSSYSRKIPALIE